MSDKTLVIIPPLSNTVFPILVHQCESDPVREEGVRSLLNAIIAGRNGMVIEKIVSTTVESTQPGSRPEERLCRLDIVVQSQEGDLCLVEIQLSPMIHVVPRLMSYFAVHRGHELPKGVFDYRMPKYALIAIIDFDYPLLRKEPYFHVYNTFQAENAPHLKLSEQLQVHVVSLHRFRELGIDSKDDLSNWMQYYSGAYADPVKVGELIKMTKEMQGLDETYRLALQDPAVQRQYQYEQMARADYYAEMRALRDEVIAEGRAEGRIEGREEGRAEGREEGIAEGESLKAKEIAQEMLAEGDSPEKVARITKLSLSEVQELLNLEKN